MQRLLAERRSTFEPSGGGPVLTDLATGAALAKSSLVGPPCMALVRRPGAGFPGHPQAGIPAQALARL
ncbi:MAG: hypothetical protein ACK40I_13020 [Tabrizicola sp.]